MASKSAEKWQRLKNNPEALAAEKARKAKVAREWRRRYPDRKRAENKRTFKNTPWYYNAFYHEYVRHMPPWADKQKILAIYKEAYERGLEVDHIHPRNGDGFCGLHVDYNLQLMTKSDNAKKRNRFPPGLP